MTIIQRLFELQDAGYAKFQAMLTPSVSSEHFIGVRIPAARKLSKELRGSEESKTFLSELPHRYYDENMLHGLLVSEIKDYGECIAALEAFLPFVDNWAVCDTMAPKVLGKHKQELYCQLQRWICSEHVYTCRFAIVMLMRHFLDKDFRSEALELVAEVSSDEYYINMARAWFFATALTKQWDASIGLIEAKSFDLWTHNKSIQKAIESYRISGERKDYLRALRINTKGKHVE